MTTEEPETTNAPKPGKPIPRAIWAVAILAAVIPAVVTAAGALTSPPIMAVPEGHIIHLEANRPSEHTSTLREMISIGHDGKWHLLVSEHEPQNIDAGSREWISMPTVSPDGAQVAYIKEKITLQEEEQSDIWELWALPIIPETQKAGKPRMLADLSKAKLNEIRGISWSPDGSAIYLAHKGDLVRIDAATGAISAFSAHALPDARWPVAVSDNLVFLIAGPPANSHLCRIVASQQNGVRTLDFQMKDPVSQYASSVAITQDGKRIAYPSAGEVDRITITDPDGDSQSITKVNYGWSLFGGRHVSAVHWSPSGRYLGYSVTKPPVGEDELFYLDTQTGKSYKLPFRAAQTSWTWSR